MTSSSKYVAFINDYFLRRFDARIVRDSWLESVLSHQEASVEASIQDEEQDHISKVRRLSTINDIDNALNEVDIAFRVSDDAMREVFKTFEFRPALDDLPQDPFSKEYIDYQFSLYEKISGKKYNVNNEASEWIDFNTHSTCPFPYYTQSFNTVSDQLMMVALIIRTLRLKSGAKILEFGPGWGNTTLALAQMGYQVTAIDIEQRFLKIVEARCSGLLTPPRMICGDFGEIENLEDSFDAILFYESFHHCSNHQSLIRHSRTHLAPGGQVMFASEPITDAFPMPWGLRLDGQSLWAIRKFGWLELGFTEMYFRELLLRNGLSLEKHNFPITELGTIFIARPLSP